VVDVVEKFDIDGAAHVPSALRKFVVPPPDKGTRPASVAVKSGNVASAPVLLAIILDDAVYVRSVPTLVANSVFEIDGPLPMNSL
jgi:hypothetical protein